MNKSSTSIVDDFMYGSNVAQAHVTIRMGFLRKVYGILSVQLLSTTLISALIMSIDGLKEFIQINTWPLYTCLIANFIVLFALMMKKNEYPINYYLLAAFTIFESITIGIVCSFFDKWTVIQAFVLTSSIVICLTLYTLQSKRDYSNMGATLFTFLWLMIIAGFIHAFLPYDSTFNLIISFIGAFVFSLFIIYDTHMLMKKLNPEEYIVAVINLYLDIINLFLEILKILNELKGRD